MVKLHIEGKSAKEEKGIVEDYEYGEVIKRLREERNLTQEQLAFGICATSTLSRIENGENLPGKDIFKQLMDRMGVKDFSYEDVFFAKRFEKARMKKDILEALRGRDISRAEEKLIVFAKKILSEDDMEDREFYVLMNMLLCQARGMVVAGFVEQCRQMIERVVPLQGEEVDFSSLITTPVQRLILNNMGLGCLSQGEAQRAYIIFSILMQSAVNTIQDKSEQNRSKAIIYNNLALCQAQLGVYKEALILCDKGIKYAFCDGSGELWLMLYRTKMEILTKKGDLDEKQEIFYLIKRAYNLASGGRLNGRTLEDFLQEPKGISIL